MVACLEPYDFDLPPSLLTVVDSKVSTEVGESYVTLYETNQRSGRVSLTDHTVQIVSSTGQTFDFVESDDPGVYLPQDANFTGTVGEAYRVNITSPEDFEIVSEFDTIQEVVDFDLVVEDSTIFLTSVIDQDVKAVIAEFQPNVESHFAKFTFEFTYIHFLTGNTIRERSKDEFKLFECAGSLCESSIREVVQLEPTRVWIFNSNSPACQQDRGCNEPCCFEFQDWATDFTLRGEVLSKQAHDFWSEVELLLSNDGLVFDTFPFPVKGNVSCETCPFDVVGLHQSVVTSIKVQNVFL